MQELKLYDVSRKEQRINMIAEAYVKIKAGIAQMEEELDRLKIEMDEVLENNNTIETESFSITKSDQERRVFNLNNALASISETILAPFISKVTYQTYRVREKAISMSKAA